MALNRTRPTPETIASAIHATPVYGDPESLTREVSSYKVAATELPVFLDHIEAGSLIITPGDRSDIILGSMLSYPSSAYPQIAGLLLSGGVQPAAQPQRAEARDQAERHIAAGVRDARL